MSTMATSTDLLPEVFKHILSLKGKAFTDLPLELIELILTFTDPITVARFSSTCSLYFSLVYDSEHQRVWRSLFLDDYDDPYQCLTAIGLPKLAPDEPFDWKGEVQRRERAYTVVTKLEARNNDELLGVLNTIISMAIEIPPASPVYNTDGISLNLVCLVAYSKLSTFLEVIERQMSLHSSKYDEAIVQACARAHTLLGMTMRDFLPTRRMETRVLVYDIDRYTEETNWGPFLPGGSHNVDWVLVRCVQHAMLSHVVEPPERITDVVTTLPYCQPQIAQNSKDGDWAGVEGAWTCMFCFVDHRDLMAFNATNPRDSSMFMNPHFIEVFRKLHLKFTMTKTTPNPRFPSRPTIHFTGHIQQVHRMEGTVSVAEDNTIRWHFLSGEHGNLMWSSQGVQIGGIQSIYGVLGSWTTTLHEPDDPVGPMWLRKELDAYSDMPPLVPRQ